MRLDKSNTLGYLTKNIRGYMFGGMNKTTLAQRLKMAMDEGGFTQASLAQAAGISQPSVWKIASGRTQESVKLFDIAKALGVRPEWLADGTGDMKPYRVASNSIEDYYNKEPPEKIYYDPSRTLEIWDESGPTRMFTVVPDIVDTKNARAYRLKFPTGFPELPDGSMIVVDTEEQPGNQDFVFAEIKGVLSAYKFISRAGSNYLDVGDSRLPLIVVNEDVNIIGVIVYMARSLKR
ncbi:helix-turn-helix domain-containing protein [Rahnella aceris]|uniref:helix-turn-helix domain-containing protein n=1 Tax=Rahnella sp. (strain Y9602) TaxID=2703885 RepID=UPI001C27AA89|nr:helix-turn-helix domain-containing protein [Rahnella aceris]MBU9842147.1 helix-turn-helix domain-containing protein [Rahnella aceris]